MPCEDNERSLSVGEWPIRRPVRSAMSDGREHPKMDVRANKGDPLTVYINDSDDLQIQQMAQTAI